MEFEDTFIFCQSNLPFSSFSVFQDLRKNKELCDTIIKTQNRCFSVHRVILAAGIPFFRAVFKSEDKDKEKEIYISDVDSSALESMINFAYNGEVKISAGNVHSIFQASRFLQLGEVQDACEEFLSKMLRVNKVLLLPAVTYDTNTSSFVGASCHSNAENFQELMRFSRSPHTCLKETISNNAPELLNETYMDQLASDFLVEPAHMEEGIGIPIDCRIRVEKVVRNNTLLKKTKATFECVESVSPKPSTFNSGIYAVCCCLTSGCSVSYYDFKHEEWNSVASCGSHDIIYHVAAVDDRIYVFHSETVQVFHLETLEWKKLEPTHRHIDGSAIAAHGAMIYCCGSRHVDFSDKIRCFDTRKNKWLDGGTMRIGRSFCSVASLEDSIYITGGYTAGWNHDIVEKYNPATGISCEVSSMLVSRSGHASVGARGKIYVCGGWTSDFFREAEMYDPDTDEWSSIRSMTIPRGYFTLIFHDDKIYALGGLTKGCQFCLGVDVYDPENNQWKYGLNAPEGFPFAVSIAIAP